MYCVNRQIAHRYLIGEQIGAGATSRVHVAVDERLGRRVAIKLLDAGMVSSADPAARERFLREGPTSASFSHPSAVTVFDAGEDDGDLYIVMELVEGPSLAARLASEGRLPIDDAVRITHEVLSALAAAHAAGIVHRDVKPANVLLGGDGVAKLADFGIAKRFDELDDSVTRTGTVIGTPRYLAPEQALGAPVTPASDVYSMGLLLYEMLSGCTPFPGTSPVAVVMAQQSQAAPDVRLLRADVSSLLAATVARALARDPSARFTSAADMAIDLDAAWSPPSSGPSQSAIDTQVIHVAEVPAAEVGAVGVRSGETQIMPVAAATAVPVISADAVPVVRERKRRFPRMAGVVAVLLLVAVGYALVGQGRGQLAIPQSAVDQLTATTVTAAAAQSAVAAPASVGLPLVSEIIAGFPGTTDPSVFLQQLRVDPTVVGSSGQALADELAKVLAERSARKQRDRAKELRNHLVTWVNAGDLNPAIAAALDPLLAPLAEAALK